MLTGAEPPRSNPVRSGGPSASFYHSCLGCGIPLCASSLLHPWHQPLRPTQRVTFPSFITRSVPFLRARYRSFRFQPPRLRFHRETVQAFPSFPLLCHLLLFSIFFITSLSDVSQCKLQSEEQRKETLKVPMATHSRGRGNR